MHVSHQHSLPIRTKLSLLLVCLVAACQDSPPTGPAGLGPQFDISEARFGDGNPDLFFAPPLAASPSSADPEFDEGSANGALVPYLRVCETDGAPGVEGCTLDVTEAVTGSPTGFAMGFNGGGETYQVNWHTDELQEGKAYRIEIWGAPFTTAAERAAFLALTFPDDYPLVELQGRPRWLFGWRDIAHSPSVSSCNGTEEFCLINYGQTIPVKVRIEDFVFCPASRNCAVQFVRAGVDANLEAVLDAGSFASSVQLAIPGQNGTDFALAFEPCTAEEKAAAEAFSALPTFGPCLKTLAPPSGSPIVLESAATISYCVELDEQSILSKLADPEQLELVGVHHFSTGGNPNGPIVNVEAWPHVAATCEQSTSGGVVASAEPPHTFLGYAQAAGRRVLSLFGPEPVMALDLGGGGEGFKLWSFYMLALPTKFEYEFPGDADQRGIAGSPYTLRAKATDLLDRPVWGARVGWSVISSPGGGATVSTSPVLTDIAGISETSVMLSPTGGNNVFHATGLGIADDRGAGCTLLGGGLGAAACNGSRTIYDPFQPTGPALLGGIQIIPVGTRLPFTVFGCAPGQGTPAAVDGTLAPGEWECANSTTFPVSLSGGSTTATLYWMNDGANFHIAVSVPGSNRTNGLRVDWDSDGDAPAALADGAAYTTAKEAGDDIWEFTPPAGTADKFIDASCSASSQSGCGTSDATGGGASQTVAAFNNTQGGVTVYEMSHPLTTTDTCTAGAKKGCSSPYAIDLRAAAPGNDAGFFVTLRMGSGAQGNTQWPGFLSYMKVTIK